MSAVFALCALLVVSANGAAHEAVATVEPVATGAAPTQTIVEIAIADPRFSTLVELITLAGLEISPEVTVFAPTNSAFALVPATTVAYLKKPENVETLKYVLTYHVLTTKVDAATAIAANDVWLETYSSEMLHIKVVDGNVIVGNNASRVTSPDVMATDGIIHVVDQVLIPPKLGKTIVEIATDASMADTVGTLASLVGAAGQDFAASLGSTESTLTVFAPTNAAFAKVDAATLTFLTDPANVEAMKSVLGYHTMGVTVMSFTAVDMITTNKGPIWVDVLNGDKLQVALEDGKVMVGGPDNASEVIGPDNQASNGVIHLIDQVMIPPALRGNLVEYAQSEDELSTLVAGVIAADLVDTLSTPSVGLEAFTVFAPSNAAFALLPEGVLETLLKPENKESLKSVLLYHVLPVKMMSYDLAALDLSAGVDTPTAQGSMVNVMADTGGKIFVGGVKIQAVDFEASNGVAHMIMGVMLPPDFVLPGAEAGAPTMAAVEGETSPPPSGGSALNSADEKDGAATNVAKMVTIFAALVAALA